MNREGRRRDDLSPAENGECLKNKRKGRQASTRTAVCGPAVQFFVHLQKDC